MAGIAVIFVITGLLVFREFRADVMNHHLANQMKMTRIIHQSLNLYFDKLRFITENAVYHPAFEADRTKKEDDLRYKKAVYLADEDFSRLGITSVLETPRKAISSSKRTSAQKNWQVYKALPELDANGNLVAAERRLLARNILKAFTDVHYAFEMDANGDLVFLEPFDIQKNITSFNYEFRDYLRLAKKSRATAVSEGYISHDVQRTQIITVATPVFDKSNKVAKVFAVSVSAATLREKVFRSLQESMNLQDGTAFYLIDRHGHVVASSSGKDIYFPTDSRIDDEEDRGNLRYVGFFKEIEWQPDVLESGNVWERRTKSWQVSTLRRDYSGEYLNHSGKEVFGSFYPMPIAGTDSLNWGVLIETPKAGLLAFEQSLKQVFAGAAAALAIILSALSFFILKNIRLLEIQVESKETEIERISAQVAHDIRSPLIALNTVAQQSAKLPEDERVLVRSAVGRIREIANQLIDKHRLIHTPVCAPASLGLRTTSSKQLIQIQNLVETLVSEKRLQFQDRPHVEILTSIEPESIGLFADIHAAEFRRVLSNLINNSVEAITDSGRVVISVRAADFQFVTLAVSDNGRGIPDDIASGLMNRGVSHGKPGGLGLGLYHARTTVEELGGQIDISSEKGIGTKVKITLPRAPAPAWFVDEIKLRSGQNLVILDDDPSIHNIWMVRLEQLRLTQEEIRVKHLSDPNEFESWLINAPVSTRQSALFLIDYEFPAFARNGLDMIERFSIGRQSILVTSSHEEPAVQRRCETAGIRLLPKNLAATVPVIFDGRARNRTSGYRSNQAELSDLNPS
jgi:signal transduction histidine kinase